MKIFLLAISFFWLLVGLFALINPSKLKSLYTSLVKPIKALFIPPIAVGMLLLWAQPASSLAALIAVIGILAVIKGLLILILPINLLKSTLNYFLSRSDRWWRVYGVFIILLGLVVGWSVL
jgi:uncharacterized protein YjeT (DUF2065 family)